MIWLDVLMVLAVVYLVGSGVLSLRKAGGIEDRAAAEALRRAGRTSLAIAGAVLVAAVLF